MPRVRAINRFAGLWSGLRRAIGWSRASRRQRLMITLGVVCAPSIVTGGALAAAGIGKPGPFLPVPTAAANRAEAAAWIVQQVGPEVTISCDPAMCGQLRENGLPAARLRSLPTSAHGLLRSGLIVATPAIRGRFGTSLATAYAPLVIAGFGSGAGRVDVRVTAPGGAAAFRSQLAAEHVSLVSAGRQLLRDQNIEAAPAARAVLRNGLVDSRLAATLSVLAAGMPLRLAGFDDLSPGASSAVPLRGAEIGARSPAGVSAILAFLRAQRGAYRPAQVAVTRGAAGQTLVTVRFDAPGLIDPGTS